MSGGRPFQDPMKLSGFHWMVGCSPQLSSLQFPNADYISGIASSRNRVSGKQPAKQPNKSGRSKEAQLTCLRRLQGSFPSIFTVSPWPHYSRMTSQSKDGEKCNLFIWVTIFLDKYWGYVNLRKKKKREIMAIW